jgi:pimeloyl-ACP methyl ester carboxylesterase
MALRRLAFALILAASAATLRADGSRLDRIKSRFAPYQGIRIHYKSVGSGSAAVLFIHGWICDMSVWRGQVPAVEGRVRALFVDLPGFGRSDKPDVPYTMEYLAGAVDAVMQAAGVKRAVLVGHSMGTPVIRQYYRKYPARVIALVAVDGALRSFFKNLEEAQPFLARFEGPDFAANVSRMMDGLLGDHVDPAARAEVRLVALATPQRVAASAMRGMLDPAIWGDDPIEVPMLAVMAPNAGWTADYVAYVKRLVPNIRYETMNGAGHFLMLERPAEFNSLLDDFLRSLGVVR